MERPSTDRREQRRGGVPTVSAVLPDSALVEMLYRPDEQQSVFAVWKDDVWRHEPAIVLDAGRRLVPFSPQNNLIRNEVVLFPSAPEEYATDESLIAGVQAYIHRYTDLSPVFEKI